jgi:hypothetical protein
VGSSIYPTYFLLVVPFRCFVRVAGRISKPYTPYLLYSVPIMENDTTKAGTAARPCCFLLKW